MKRREAVAGLGSLSVLGSAGALLWHGPPSFGDDDGIESTDEGSTDVESSNGAVEVETIDARGSEAGSIAVPSGDVMVISFFVTGCGNCQAQMPYLEEARTQLRDEYEDDVGFLSVTYQSFDHMPADELREWWTTHSGNWTVGYDPNSVLAQEFGVVGYPVTVAVDGDGQDHWSGTGVQTPETIVTAVDDVFEAR